MEPKTNRSRTEVGRVALGLLRSRELVAAARGSDYDVQFFETERQPADDDLVPLLEPKTNRPRAEIGRTIFERLKNREEVWVGRAESDFDVQVYSTE